MAEGTINAPTVKIMTGSQTVSFTDGTGSLVLNVGYRPLVYCFSNSQHVVSFKLTSGTTSTYEIKLASTTATGNVAIYYGYLNQAYA